MGKIENTDEMQIITLSPDNILDYGFCGYKDASKHNEMTRKAEWYREYYPKGLRIKIITSPESGSQGMIEYIPGKYAHRPVKADNYMFIHCLFVGYKKIYKGQGLAGRLIESCIDDAGELNLEGVAVVTRKGSFMAKRDIFVKNGFTLAEQRKPDFELLTYNLKETAALPGFMDSDLKKYNKGLYILRSVQCPYTEKNVAAMVKTAEDMGLVPQVIDLMGHEGAQNNPSPFGTFAIIYNGNILSHHPVSNTRFKNIMSQLKN